MKIIELRFLYDNFGYKRGNNMCTHTSEIHFQYIL